MSDEGTREETESEIFGDEDVLAERPAGEELEEVSEESAGEELTESAETESEVPRRRRRRRGRRRPGDRGPRGDRPSPHHPQADAMSADDGTDEEPDEEDLEEDSGDLTGESELGAEDDSEEGEEAPRVYRNVPTWEEAISYLVHKRPEGRSRDDSGGPREGRRDGGRPR